MQVKMIPHECGDNHLKLRVEVQARHICESSDDSYIYMEYIMECYSTLKKNVILPFVTWMDLKGIMISEINQRKINTICIHLYMESKKQNK